VSPGRILFVFLDGVGIGPADPSVNPFLRADLPVLLELRGGSIPTLDSISPSHETDPGGDARLLPLDACLGLDGLPQSGTGQIALLTGRNAPRLFGRHFGPWPPVRLRPLLDRENLLVRAVAQGRRVIFANAYPEGYPSGRDRRRVAAPPLAALAAGLLTRTHLELARGRAVASEITNEGWIRHLGFRDLPRVTAAQAGRNLAQLSAEADLTFYAHYLTDTAGHRGGMAGAVEALERVDRFLGGVVARLPADALLLVASDHGNLEDVRGGHTRNPALGLALGTGADRFSSHPALTELAPVVLRILAG